jgi:Ribonuclease G/E
MGGIIVIDFIDQTKRENRKKIVWSFLSGNGKR